jgi:hypothetical protein
MLDDVSNNDKVVNGLSTIENYLCKILKGVKYHTKLTSRLIKFEEIATQLDISTKRSLCIDVKMR